jgi:hypothetical protein
VLREAGILIEKQSATSLNFGLQMWIDAALGSWRNTYLETRMEQCILLSSGILMSCRLMNTSRLKTRVPTNDRPPRDGLSRMERVRDLPLCCLILLNRRCGLSDHLDDYIRLREHGNVAAFHLNHSRSHTL